MSREDVSHKIAGWCGLVAWGAVAALKNSVVREEPRYLKVRLGPARGAVLYTTYRHGSRMILGLYESELTSYVRRYVRPGDVCYDIGSAGGYYTFAFARLAAPGVVHGFDLDEQLVDQLRALTTRNTHLGSVVNAHHIGIGASHVDETHTSVDTLVFERRWPRPNVMKLDVEGYELQVLKGSTRVLQQYRPRLMIEVHSEQLEAECERLLTAVGYTVTVVPNRAFMAEHAFRRGHNRWICAE